MIRIYLCEWERVGDRVINPISTFASATGNIPGLAWISYHYSEAKADGTPSHPLCIAFVNGTDFTGFDSVAGTAKLPAGNLSEALSVQQRSGIINAIRGKFDVPIAVLSSAVTRKDIITALAKHIHPQFKSIGNVKDEDFE